MRRRSTLALLLVLATVLGGCAGQPAASTTPTMPAGSASATPAPCPSDALRREAFAAAQDARDTLLAEVAATVRLEGTVEGEVGTFLLASVPASKSLRITAPGTEIRVAGNHYSIETGTGAQAVAAYGRNHEPGAIFGQFLDEFEDDSPDFASDLKVDDYTASCKDLGGVPAIEYRYEEAGRKTVLVAERTGKFRPLAGEVVDPAMKDNHRISVSYEVPTIEVDTSLPRAPLTWEFDTIDSFTNQRGGLYASGTIADGTEWAPLGELEVHLVDQGDGTVYFSEALASKVYDMEDGDLFRYTDQDGNGLLSDGDSFFMDVGPGLDIVLFDTWAQAYT